MNENEYTLFQQLVSDAHAEQMAEDIKNTDWKETQQLDLRVAFTQEDATRILLELRELYDDED